MRFSALRSMRIASYCSRFLYCRPTLKQRASGLISCEKPIACLLMTGDCSLRSVTPRTPFLSRFLLTTWGGRGGRFIWLYERAIMARKLPHVIICLIQNSRLSPWFMGGCLRLYEHTHRGGISRGSICSVQDIGRTCWRYQVWSERDSLIQCNSSNTHRN